MIPKKIYLNYVNEDDKEKTWSEEPVSVADCKMQNREYTDLSQVWHDVTDKPKEGEYILVMLKSGGLTSWNVPCVADVIANFNFFNVKRWAYANDLLPKTEQL